MTDLADELERIAASNSDLTEEERDACRRAAEALRWAKKHREMDRAVRERGCIRCGYVPKAIHYASLPPEPKREEKS